MNCANFGIFVTSTFCKDCQKLFDDFHFFFISTTLLAEYKWHVQVVLAFLFLFKEPDMFLISAYFLKNQSYTFLGIKNGLEASIKLNFPLTWLALAILVVAPALHGGLEAVVAVEVTDPSLVFS